MITTAEYIRERTRAEAAEARVLELEAELAALKQPQKEVLDVLVTGPDSENTPE